MANQNNNGTPADVNGLVNLIRSGRLAWRLLFDPRVATITKLAVPLLAGLYLLSPVDLLPDVVPVLGQLDDVAILALAARLFIQMAPPAVVAEHRANLAGQPVPGQAAGDQDEVIDTDYRVIR